MVNSIKKCIAAVLAAILSMFVLSASVYAEEDTKKSSLYFDTDASFQYIYLSDSFLSYSLAPVGKSHSSLGISGQYVESEGSSSSVLFFNSSDFGLDSFKNCKISVDASLNKSLPEDAVRVKLYSDGSELRSVPITSNDSWGEYSIEIGECSNNIAGIYVQFKEPYDGAICSIDNFTVVTSDGTIASLNGIKDEVKTENIPPFLNTAVIIAIVVLIIGAIIFVIREIFFKYR